MLKLRSLSLSGVGRFVEEQTVNFDTLGNLIQVDGENRNTGGSSGSGKSTIFNALDYLLGLNDLPTTVLQSRLTKEPLSVTGIFDWDGQVLEITRNKKGLRLDLEGNVKEGSSKLTEERLDEILGMPRDLFRKILHKRQKEGGFFLDFTPKKMYEFLTDALNLAAERKKLEKVESVAKELEIKKNTSFYEINSIQSALKATQEGVLSLGLPPIRDIHQPVILELKGKYDVSAQRFKEIEEQCRSEARELEESRPKINVSTYDTGEQDRLEKRRKTLEADKRSIEQAERERQESVRAIIGKKDLEKIQVDYEIREASLAKASALEIAEQVRKIRESICPTCEQCWIMESAKVKENELLAQLSSCKEKIMAGMQAVEREKLIGSDLLHAHSQLTPFVDPRIAEINAECVTINANLVEEKNKAELHNATQNAANNSVLKQFAEKQASLRSTHFKLLDQFRGQMEVDRRAFEISVGKLKAYEDARVRYESALNEMKTNEKNYQISLDRANFDLKTLENKIVLTENLRKAVKEFISCSFDDALESIGDGATKIIRCIPTMSNATIQFEGQKETKDGKVKEEVNAVISMDGDIGIPIKSLSGGERSSVDLAVDLAVIDFIENESAKGINVFILDEPFTGLDTVSIEMALEVLKNSNSNKKLIVVDHNPEVKQMVSDRLVVVRDGQTSSITNQEVSNG